MSIVTIRTVNCDALGCGEWDDEVGTVVDAPAVEARAQLRSIGWAVGLPANRIRGYSRDYCPKHAHMAVPTSDGSGS